jgi:hypothetical protein
MNRYSLDPYHSFGLKRNPFFAPQDLQIEGDRWLDFGYSQAICPGQRLFIQFLGEKGAGKTSHLLHWQKQTGGHYFYQAPWQWQTLPPTQPDLQGTAIAYWDEANRIPLPILIWALKQACKLQVAVVVGSHQNLAPLARLVGYQTKTIHLNHLTLPRLKCWINQHFIAEFLPERSPEQTLAFQQLQNKLTDQFLLTILNESAGSWRKTATVLHRWLAQQVRIF